MKRNDIQTIGDVLRLTVQQCDMTAKLDECRAAELWRPIVGDGLANRCGRPTVRGGVMTSQRADDEPQYYPQAYQRKARQRCFERDKIHLLKKI